MNASILSPDKHLRLAFDIHDHVLDRALREGEKQAVFFALHPSKGKGLGSGGSVDVVFHAHHVYKRFCRVEFGRKFLVSFDHLQILHMQGNDGVAVGHGAGAGRRGEIRRTSRDPDPRGCALILETRSIAPEW